jgi:hypothetical protein
LAWLLPQQNRAIDASKCDWIYSIDADERITPELKIKILNTIIHEEQEDYDVPRKSFFNHKTHDPLWLIA